MQADANGMTDGQGQTYIPPAIPWWGHTNYTNTLKIN